MHFASLVKWSLKGIWKPSPRFTLFLVTCKLARVFIASTKKRLN